MFPYTVVQEGLPYFHKVVNFFLKSEVIFSIGIHFFISERRLVIGRGESDFHVNATHFLAVARAISVNLILKLFLKFTFVKLPRRHISGSSGTGTSIIKSRVSQTSCQKACHLVHCQVECKKVPSVFPHLKHISDISRLYLQWGIKVFSQPPIVQVLPLKKTRGL